MKNMMMVKMSEIKEDFNPRTDFSSVAELAKSIESVGLLQPIVVQAAKDGYVIVDGACRFRALKELDQKETQVIVIDVKSVEEAQMAANLVRSDLSILERARGYERMVRLFPARYNAVGIAKMFGESKKDVERLISVAKRIPVKYDAKMGKMEFEDLELLAQIPAKHIDAIAHAIDATNGRPVWAALAKVAKELDWNCDAVTTGKLVSEGRAFVIKGHNRQESAYTLDTDAFKMARDVYEAKRKKEYGVEDKKGKERIVEKSEKQKAAEKLARKKEKEAHNRAVFELPGLFKKFMDGSPTIDQIHAAARELFEHHMDSDKCRRLWAAFNVKGCDKVASYDLRGKTYDVVIKPHVNIPSDISRVLEFCKLGWKDGMRPEQAWVEGMKKS